jgi:hypothetical protein
MAMRRQGTEKKNARVSTTGRKDQNIDISDPTTWEFLDKNGLIPTRKMLEALTNYQQFKQVISQIRNIDSLRAADEFAKEMREAVQRQIKLVLWDKEIEGTVIFNEIVQDNSRGYLKASTRHSSKLARPLTNDELINAIEKKQKRQTSDPQRNFSAGSVKRKSRT